MQTGATWGPAAGGDIMATDRPVQVADAPATSALGGLHVLDLSNVPTGAQVSQLLADFGAEVVHVEPPGGSPLRDEAAWPCWARGKRSIELDLHDPADLAVVRSLALGSDVVLETFRPGVADRLGVGYDELVTSNPGLVYASITGFGRNSPLADLQGYEAIVQAKFGVFWSIEDMSERPGPSFATARYASYPASQLALQGILAALYERSSSGLGQRVEVTLAQGLTVHDTFNWYSRVVAQRFSEGFVQTPLSVRGVPSGGLSFRLLIALTKDGHWVQFSQTVDRLFRAMMRMLELEWMFDDPRWRTAPDFDDIDERVAFWEILLEAVRSKTLAEWHAEFDAHPDVWAESFSRGAEVLDHPQMRWNGMVAELKDPERDVVVRQPAALVRMDATPADLSRPAPMRGEHDDGIRADAAAVAKAAAEAAVSRTAAEETVEAGPTGAPLAGVTVLELGTYYAAPFGATLMAEYGARVIKLEQLDGDPHRNMLPFPEVAGLKVLLGKESVAVDIATEEGRRIAYELVRRADVVLQSFRAGVAERLRLDPATLLEINPHLVYLCSPGYGTGGPLGHRPAFAPTIGAAAGQAWRNAGPTIPERPDLALDEIKANALRLAFAVMGVGNADGFSAVSAGTGLLLGLVARQRGAGGQAMLTTMLSSTAHALSEAMIDDGGHVPIVDADPGLHGLGALYRLYETSDGWVFLAAPSDREWVRLSSALAGRVDLASDERFETAEGRRAHDGELSAVLADLFLTRPAAGWEADLRAADVACVEVVRGPVEANYLDEGSLGRASGFVTTADHPMFDEIPRLDALVRFSRSATVTNGAGLCGSETTKVLHELGYDDDQIAAWRTAGVVGGD
jgi:crotonobetainyl-CoA:carnitine CoA-transferase CaiB-like acyl-CoA transferase